MPILPELRRWRQEDLKFKTSLGYREKLYLKKKETVRTDMEPSTEDGWSSLGSVNFTSPPIFYRNKVGVTRTLFSVNPILTQPSSLWPFIFLPILLCSFLQPQIRSRE
jgi:hypothetical protein